MANVKLSAIADGGALVAGTDQLVMVRNGTTDVLGTVTTIVAKTAPSGVVVGTTDSQALTNKTIALGSNTITGTLSPANGGTGVANNASSTVTISGSFPTTVTITGTTAVSLPTSGTMATLAGNEALTNKTVNGLTITSTTGTLTLANSSSIVTSGGNSITFTSTGPTTVTLPTTGTLVNTAVTTLSSLTSVGTIGTGVWQGTPVTVPYGGTGGTTFTSTALISGNGTTAMTATGVLVNSSNQISGYLGNLNTQTGTTYTFQASDTGKIVEFNSAATVTGTVPNSLGTGWCCTISQTGTAAATIAAAAGGTVSNRSSFTKTAGQYALMTIYCKSNTTGTNAAYILAGDGST